MPLSPPARLAWGAAYTLGMSQKAMLAKAFGATDERVREYVQEWAYGMRERMRIDVRVTGGSAVDWSRPCVVMANHQSYLDVLALYSALPRPFGFVAKKQLFSVPAFGGVMRAIGCVPVDRARRTEAIGAMRAAADEVRRTGVTIAVFPEGTRSGGDSIQPLKKGPFYLVELAQVPIVPVGIRGTAALMPRSNTRIVSGRVEVHIGAPIGARAAGGETRRGLMADVRAELARLAAVPIAG